mmetsp:Transcript_19378/g.34327  ORF Transcript_19378/g.34327 Transcript_19378/m.34327 type:complete len:166 (-) Transcript_19378:655-1152(-)
MGTAVVQNSGLPPKKQALMADMHNLQSQALLKFRRYAMLNILMCLSVGGLLLPLSGYLDCHKNGIWSYSEEQCQCWEGYAGDLCEYSDIKTCHGQGSVQQDGSCVCWGAVQGFHCECPLGTAGERCQYTDADLCHGKGQARNDGSCKCSTLYKGDRCEKHILAWG